MTDRERLVGLLVAGMFKFTEKGFVDNTALADYLLANGVIVPPCKVGDKVWVINRDEDDYDGYMFLAQSGNVVIVSPFVNDYDTSETLDYFVRKTLDGMDADLYVFPLEDCYTSKEEAEKALKEREIT